MTPPRGQCPYADGPAECPELDLQKRLANCSASWDTLKAERDKLAADLANVTRMHRVRSANHDATLRDLDALRVEHERVTAQRDRALTDHAREVERRDKALAAARAESEHSAEVRHDRNMALTELDVVKAQRDTAANDLAAWRAESQNVRDAWQKLTDLAPSTCSCPDFELVRAEGCKCGAEDRWRAMREAINRLGPPPHEPGELETLRRWKADTIAAWAKFLRAPTDAESDEGGKELDRLMDLPPHERGQPGGPPP